MEAHQLVEQQAAAHPEAIAVASAEGSLTYGELVARADALAARLAGLGVGPEVIVGLAVPSSLAMVVGALGVLKSGGAYLPIDPHGPAERIAGMLADAGVEIVVGLHGDALPAGSWRTVRLDRQGRMHGAGPSRRPRPGGPEDLAYVIYTSGSTGHPKGVLITHRNLSNLISWHSRTFAVTAADRSTQLTSVGFDAAVWELWPPLAAGASVRLVDPDVRGDPRALQHWLIAQRITIAFVPTSIAERLLACAWPSDTSLRVLLTGADALRRYPPPGLPFELVNNYGPTECTVVATSGRVSPPGRADRPPSIGRPIDHVQIHVLDERQQPVPVGVDGEICIGGAGVGRGYLGRPELTAQAFIPDPFSPDPGARLYRTGDRGCRLPDGEIAFLGRIDDQVKVRGFRIEPGEVAFALNQHPAISESVVVARQVRGESRLVAYVVLADAGRQTPAGLRDFLEARLPPYMLPATFVALPALPVTAHGKIDRTALPAPDAHNTLTEPRTEAGSPLEQQVVDMLADLLGLETIGVTDNFFHLGGHSLLAAQVIARVNDGFAVDLPLRTLFDRPTARQLAAEIERLVLAKVREMSEEDVQALLAGPAPEEANP